MKGRTLHTNRREPSIHDANSRVSGQLTEQLIRAVQLLPESGFKTTYLKQEFLSKFVSKDTDPAVVRRQRAINKWLSVESDNAATNVRLLITPEEYNILPRLFELKEILPNLKVNLFTIPQRPLMNYWRRFIKIS